MIAEMIAVHQDEALLSDQLRIIAGEAKGLTANDRESLRKSAFVLEEALRMYSSANSSLQDTKARLAAVEDRLREANLALAKSHVFPTISARWSI